MESFKEVYEWFTIDKDVQRWMDIQTTYPEVDDDTVGENVEVTYFVKGDIEVDTEMLRGYAFASNTGLENIFSLTRPSVCIVGGGPVGLYTAVIFQKKFPEWFVYVLEKRHDEENRRILTRSQVLFLEKIKNRGLLLWLPELANQTTVPINVLEYHLARYAQTKGVRIFHTEAITQTNLGEYCVPGSTQYVLDATGGHLLGCVFDNQRILPEKYVCVTGKQIVWSPIPLPYGCTYIGDDEYIMRSAQGDAYYVKESSVKKGLVARRLLDGNQVILVAPHLLSRHQVSEPFPILFGNLRPEQAMQNLTVGVHSIPILAVGDTYMKTNFMYGNGLYGGFLLSLFLLKTISRKL